LSENYQRYPVEMELYLRCAGQLLPDLIASILEELGFRVWVNKGKANGVDLKIFDEDNLLFVAEVVNWSPFSYMSIKRKNSIVSNLERYNCGRIFVFTTMKNEDMLDDFAGRGISTIKIGYQLLPGDYYDFFARKNRVICRKMVSEETREDVKSKITRFLRSLMILPDLDPLTV
jgi:hypothetical protein